MIVKRTAEQCRADGVPQSAAFFCRVFKVGFIGSEFHGLAATVEFERPVTRSNVGFKFELASEAWPNGTDAFGRFVASALRVDDDRLQTTDGNGRLVDNINNNLDDVLVVVVDFHLDRRQMGVQGTGTGAVVITHLGSPVATERWHYFNGLPFRIALSAIADVSRRAATSPQQRPCGACGQRPSDTPPRWTRRCRCRVAQNRANR